MKPIFSADEIEAQTGEQASSRSQHREGHVKSEVILKCSSRAREPQIGTNVPASVRELLRGILVNL